MEHQENAFSEPFDTAGCGGRAKTAHHSLPELLMKLRPDIKHGG